MLRLIPCTVDPFCIFLDRKIHQQKNLESINFQGFYLCPGLDSNQHAVSSTTTSRWLVYQFQHPGSLLKRLQMYGFQGIAPKNSGDFICGSSSPWVKRSEKWCPYPVPSFLHKAPPDGIVQLSVWRERGPSPSRVFLW